MRTRLKKPTQGLKHRTRLGGSSSRLNQRGFTLLELMVALALIAVLSVAITSSLGPALNFWGKRETDTRLKDINGALTQAYIDNALLVENSAAAVFTTPAAQLLPLAPTVNNLCVGSSGTFAALAQYLTYSASDIWHDGFGRSFCIYITPQINTTMSGINFSYRMIAVVSPGVDGAINTGTGLSSTGVLTLVGDDKGVLIDGRNLMYTLANQTLTTIQKVANAYQQYFQSQYQANLTRDTSIDYFANTDTSGGTSSSWDSQGSMPSTLGSVVSMSSIGAQTVLGLGLSDVSDAYGQVLLIDNSSNAVRSPANNTAAMQQPPYTATISTTLPGGSSLLRTVVSSY